jgi:O-antigen/teichoic acid export membrane protein
MVESKTNIKGNVLKNSTYNLLGNIVLRIFQIIQSFFMANILGPTQYGLRNGIQMYFEYGNYNHLGTNSLLSKKR